MVFKLPKIVLNIYEIGLLSSAQDLSKTVEKENCEIKKMARHNLKKMLDLIFYTLSFSLQIKMITVPEQYLYFVCKGVPRD